jgi:RNA polymerase sigma-70 factor (ECF subfamily)
LKTNKLGDKMDTIFQGEKKLKPKCIQIIDLLFFKGYTQQEALDELAIPLGTVKRIIVIVLMKREQ